MFDLNWFDMIRTYVNFYNKQIRYLSTKRQPSLVSELDEFMSKYDLTFQLYICNLYNIHTIGINKVRMMS